jgi:hypothetical protein
MSYFAKFHWAILKLFHAGRQSSQNIKRWTFCRFFFQMRHKYVKMILVTKFSLSTLWSAKGLNTFRLVTYFVNELNILLHKLWWCFLLCWKSVVQWLNQPPFPLHQRFILVNCYTCISTYELHNIGDCSRDMLSCYFYGDCQKYLFSEPSISVCSPYAAAR